MTKPSFCLALLAIVGSVRAFEPTADGIYAVFDTSLGEFTAKISYDATPLTAANFIGLAEGTIPRFNPTTGEIVEQKPYYDGLVFHRVVRNFVVQAGDPDLADTTVNGPGYSIPEELHPNLSHNPDYTLSMANQRVCAPCAQGAKDVGENTTGGQFFITAKALDGGPPAGYNLDGFYTVFGFVVAGQSVVDAIGNVPVDPATRRPITDVVINSVTILRVGEAAQKFHVTEYELPYRLPAPDIDAVAREDGEVGFEFPAVPGAKYPVELSSDLQTWTEEEFVNEGEAVSNLFVEPSPTGATFARSKAASQGPIDYQETLTNVRLNAVLKNTPPGENWSFLFKPDGTGSIIFEQYGEMKIDYYRYHRLPNGARIRLSSKDFEHELDMYIRYTSPTTGGVFVWVEDYISGNPLRYPTTGTFQIVTE